MFLNDLSVNYCRKGMIHGLPGLEKINESSFEKQTSRYVKLTHHRKNFIFMPVLFCVNESIVYVEFRNFEISWTPFKLCVSPNSEALLLGYVMGKKLASSLTWTEEHVTVSQWEICSTFAIPSGKFSNNSVQVALRYWMNWIEINWKIW